MARMSKEKTKRSKGEEEEEGGRYALLKLKNCSRDCSISCSLMAEKSRDIIFKEIQFRLLQLERNGSHLGQGRLCSKRVFPNYAFKHNGRNRKNMLFLLNANGLHRPSPCEIVSEFLGPIPRTRKYKHQGPRPARPCQLTSEAQPALDNNMESDARVKIDRILTNINSIHHLDSEIIAELRATSAGRFSIEKFPVDFSDWVAWSEKHQEIHGIEYDAQSSHIQIKATDSPLHAAATGVIGEWLQGIRDTLSRATGNEFDCIGTAGSCLGGDFNGSEKAPDEGLCQEGQEFPLVAVEVAVSERTTKVFDDAKRWLHGSKGHTKLVIVVDINEKMVGNHSKTKDWGLSEGELGQLDVPDLAKHILQWHKDNNVALIGRFEAVFYLCYHDQEPRKVWKCDFSLDRLKSECLMLENELGHITANVLVPGLDGPCFPLPFQELSTRMRRSLSRHEFKRASLKAKEKWKEMKKISDPEKISA